MTDLAVKPKERFVFIDALRAILALDVMFHHLYFMHDPIRDAMRSVIPVGLRWTVEQDLQRVQVFFVISGFVIAWSLRKLTINAGSAFNFILRRQIRLDPAYWTCLGLSAGCMALQAAFIDHSHWADVAGPKRILINMFYLQYMFHNPKIQMLYVTWTLCLEVQLYLAYIIHLFLIQWTIRKFAWAKNRPALAYLGVMAPMWLFSVWYHWDSWAWRFFVQSWYLFALGVLLCWVMEKRVPASVLLAVALLELTYGVFAHEPNTVWKLGINDPQVFWSVGITGLIYASIITGGLTTWLGNRVVQFFGRISYSIFLVQWDIGRMVEGYGLHFTHGTRKGAILSFFLAAAASIVAAYLLHICVERPSTNLAARLKPRAAKPAAEPVAVSLPNATPMPDPAA